MITLESKRCRCKYEDQGKICNYKITWIESCSECYKDPLGGNFITGDAKMRTKKIYETVNDDSVLKSFGPFRNITTDNLENGVFKGETKIYETSILENIIIQRDTIIIEKEIVDQKKHDNHK